MTSAFHAVSLLLILLLSATPTATAALVVGQYRHLWRSFVPQHRFPVGVVAYDGARDVAIANLRNGLMEMYIDVGLPPPETPNGAWHNDSEIGTIPFAVVAVAVGFNAPSMVQLELTMDELGSILRGATTDPTIMLSDGVNGTISSASLKVVLTRSTNEPLLSTVVRVGIDKGVAAFTDSNFHQQVLANPNVIWADTEEAAVKIVASTPNSITLTSFPTATDASVMVASIKVLDTASNQLVPTAPVIEASQAGAVDLSTGSAEISSLPGTKPPYPLAIPATLMISKVHDCALIAANKTTHWLNMLSSLANADVTNWGLSLSEPFITNNVVRTALTSGLCSAASIVHSRGSSGMQHLVAGLNKLHLSTKAPLSTDDTSLPFITYSGGGSGGGLTAIKAGENVLVGSGSLFTEEEYAANPTIQFIPYTSFAVSLAFNLPGVKRLVLPRCVVVAIFTGKITHWNHPEIRRFNAAAKLPHITINVWARETRSGTTGIFTAGLQALDYTCTAGNPTVRESKTWDIKFDNLHMASSTSKVINGVAAMPYSIGYAGSAPVKASGLPEAVLVDETTNKFTSPTPKFLQQAVQGATLDPTRLVVSFKREAASSEYPFAGISYVVYNNDRHGDCSAAKLALDFVVWSLTSTSASAWAIANNFAPLPDTVVRQGVDRILTARCDNVALMVPEEDKADATTLILSVTIPCVLLLLVLLGVQRLLFRDHGKNNDLAPKDQKDCLIIFTDVESSTSLWARGPMSMGPAIDIHNKVIRECIKDHKCYEVKVIGDAFMIACKSVDQGVRLAVDIQQHLYDATWPDDINAMYNELHSEKGWANFKDHGDRGVWNGLRVRVGIAFGPCEAKLDEISGGYDYFGSTVNMAARIEAAGHGGQILLQEAVADTLSKDVVDSLALRYDHAGTVELKGFDDLVPLVQLCSAKFSSRHFAGLRVEEAKRDDEGSTMDGEHLTTKKSDLSPNSTDNEATPQLPTDRSVEFSYGENVDDHEEDSTQSMYAETTTVGPDFIAALIRPLKDSEQRDLTERLCQAWRLPHKSVGVSEMIEHLTRRAIGVTRETRRTAGKHQESFTSVGKGAVFVKSQLSSDSRN